jgi:hypothetical protein
VPGVGATGGGLGDLIELQDDAFEIGECAEDRGRPREGLVVPDIRMERSTSRHSAVRESSVRAQQFQSSRQDFNLVLRERSRKGDAGKTD